MDPEIFISLKFISDIFINPLRLCSLPIICTSLVLAIASIDKPSQFRYSARNSLAYILFSELIAVTIDLCVFNLPIETTVD